MTWSAPNRPKGEITQCYNSGVVTIYAVENTAKPGYDPVERRTEKETLRYEERRLGIQRYYAAQQNQVYVERVIRTPRIPGVSNQDIAVTEDGVSYRIDLVQSAADVYPPSMDLSLVRISQTEGAV